MLEQAIRAALQRRQTVGIYQGSALYSSFDVARIVALNDEMVAYRSYDRFGRYEGTVAMRLLDIQSIALDGLYLSNTSSRISDDDLPCVPTFDSVAETLGHCAHSQVEVNLFDSDEESVVAVIREVSEEFVKFDELDESGQVTETRISHITSISKILYDRDNRQKTMPGEPV